MTSAATVQFAMPLEDARICVLLSPDAVRSELRTYHYDEHEIVSMIEAHELAPAFNIGIGGRREFRVMPSAIPFFRQSKGGRRRMLREEILAELYRGVSQLPVLDGELIRRILCCSGDHLTRLVDEKFLQQAPGTKYRKGPDGSPKILRDSFEFFLFHTAKVGRPS